jgi:NAD(P)-dependent dehydrogenase (short-subunit alcohol dehydrogenase family)
MPKWTAADIPRQKGNRVIVTGGNSGLGFETALALALAGASVIIACRDEKKGSQAMNQIRARSPEADVNMVSLDLASLKSVHTFAEEILRGNSKLDLLINNAGIMAIPKRRLTADGFEMQLGVNHLGHFALTGLLLPALLRADAPRVVAVSSIAHRTGRIDFLDLQSAKHYGPWAAYGQSKLANLLYAFELQRRIDAAGSRLQSLAAHPGYSATNLQAAGPGMNGASLTAGFLSLTNALMAQSAALGALPTLYAGTSPDALRGGFYGPSGFLELRGYPRPAKPASQARDEKSAAELWRVSEQLTGVSYGALAKQALGN